MFKKILVANRGEIALRVIFACRELGIKTVAVYSEADENSLHVRFADEDICIGAARSADSYLNVPAIISAAEITGADAIHPGYGFLSESAYLAEVCEACHIRFIGPDPHVIRLLGDKAKARRAMKKAGLPMLPGSDGPVENEDRALQLAKDIGYPVIVKAVAGGGGRGMRIVKAAAELAARARAPPSARPRRPSATATSTSSATSRRRATSSSRSSAITTASVVHLGERECSIQRRHQKLVEESPSPALTDKVRRKMGALVADAAQAVQYTNAGTFEFLMDEKGHFYFMEVNTRVQVEHPVTELVTGFDIVKEQIRIAAGERLSFRQSDVTFTGHALECRINAEDPETFVPSPGRHPRLRDSRRPGRAGRHRRPPRVHDHPVLRLDDRQGHRPRPRSRRVDRPDEAGAGHDGDRGHQDQHPAAPEDPERPRFRRRPPEHALHGAVRAAGPSRETGRVGLTAPSRPWPPVFPRLYAIVDADACARAGRAPLDVAAAFVAGGVRLLQVRAKALSGGELLRAGRRRRGDRAAGGRRRGRQRSRRRRRRGRRRRARRPGGPAGRRWPGGCSGRRRWSAARRTRRRSSTRRWPRR